MNFYRSLKICDLRDDSLYKFLERMAEKGYFQNTQQFEETQSYLSENSWSVKIICSMKNLEKLTSGADHLTPGDFALVFQSCTKLIELDINAFEFEMNEMGKDLVDQLRPGFQRLRRLELTCSMVSWAKIQEMLT
jgi:hypothetical protein